MGTLLNRLEAISPILGKVINSCYRKPKYSLINLGCDLKAVKRKFGIKDKTFEALLQYKNKHIGERCFIVATGPSLTFEDLKLIKDEYSFSMNSICKVYENTDFRPTYYGIQDEAVFEKQLEYINKYYTDQPIFYAKGLEKKNKVNEKWIPIPVNGSYHKYDLVITKKYFAKFSDNAYHVIYDGYSITYTLIQLAVYMGFKEIYLLGCDTSYSDDRTKQHFADNGVFDPEYKSAYDRLVSAYKEAKKYADSHNIKIINTTRGGMLEVFPRKTLEEIIGD